MFGRIVIVVLVGLVLWAVFARSSDASGPDERYVVRPYDTLWTIAARRYADPRQGVWAIQRENGLTGAEVMPGQALVLP